SEKLCGGSFFFFSSRRRHTRSKRDWSSDVCSSDLTDVLSVDNLKTQQAAIPTEGTYEFGTYEEMSVLNIDLEANKEYIQELLYRSEERRVGKESRAR